MARYIGSIIPVLVACLAIAYFVLRSDQPTSSNGNRIDPRTGIQFPVQASFFVGKNLALAGVGTRTKASVVKVYSVGFYSTQKALGTIKGPADLIAYKAPKVAHLHFSMGVGAEKVAAALSAVSGVKDEVVASFNDMLIKGMGGKMLKGESLSLDFDGPKVAVTVRGKPVGSAKDQALSSGLLELYLGKSSVSPTLKEDIQGLITASLKT
mmetsp:Transcript_52770/g.98062  ORF Transcript_52770/g.98062 Transcript_52770/m.98062 type:complete len:210 (+) Transcript_52770:93-722(+)